MHRSLVKRLGASLVVSAFALGSLVSIGVNGTSAHEGVPHPAHIHTGTCPAPGDVVFPLADAGAPTGNVTGSTAAIPVDVSQTSVESSLADLVASDHAIVVHESAENIGTYILCGDIGGSMISDTDLAIGLGELNESGASGVATLHDNGDGTTSVSLYVTEVEHEDGDADSGTPDAAHDMDDMGTASAEVTVDIVNFSFGDPISVSVGTTVTFKNGDTVPHTVTDKGGSFQSDKIDAGATWTHTFDTAGTFDFFCEFHANMAGTITVE